MNKVHNENELAADLRDSLARMLEATPTADEIERAMEGLRSVHSSASSATPMCQTSTESQSVSYRLALAVACSTAFILCTIASTDGWADVAQNYSSPFNEPKPISPLSESADTRIAAESEVGFGAKILLLVHVFSLLSGLFAMALSWVTVLLKYLITLWRPVATSTRGRSMEKRFLVAGSILYGTGVVFGGLWSLRTWGYGWQWDPKEITCLLSLAMSCVWLGTVVEPKETRHAAGVEHARHATLATIAFGSIFLMIPIGSYLDVLQDQHSFGGPPSTLPTILSGIVAFFFACIAVVWGSLFLCRKLTGEA